MTTNQVVVLLLDLALILIVSHVLGAVAKRFDQPAVVGEILAGVLAGPTLFHGKIAATLFPMDVRPLLNAFANVGIALFMFLIGFEFDKNLMHGKGRVTVSVSLGSVLLPFGLGTLLALYLAEGHPTHHHLGFVLFIGVAMAVTAFPVLARILKDRGMDQTPVGGLALTAAAVGDVLAWSLLAVIAALVGGNGQTQWHILLAAPYVILMLTVIRPLLRRLIVVREGAGGTSVRLLAVVVAGVLVSGGVTEWMGLHFIFGAFLLGIIMPRDGAGELQADIEGRIGHISILLLPVYFLVTGLQVNLSQFGATGLIELGLIMLVAVGGKFIGVYTAARVHGVEARQSAALATLMNTRGLTELVILTVGLQSGVLDQSLFSLMVAMALVTTIMAGPLLKIIYPRSQIQRDLAIAARQLTRFTVISAGTVHNDLKSQDILNISTPEDS